MGIGLDAEQEFVKKRMDSTRSRPRPCRSASAIGSSGVAADAPALHQGRREVGPADQRAGREPAPAAGPAADVGRVEQVLAQPGRPVGQHQRARAAVEQFEGAHRRR